MIVIKIWIQRVYFLLYIFLAFAIAEAEKRKQFSKGK